MKNSLQKLIFVFITFVVSASWASDFNAEVGFRQQSGDAASGITAKSEVGYQLGMTGHFELNGPLMLRTGLLYTQRPITIQLDSDKSSEAKIAFTYFDIPLALMYKFEDYGGAYIGVVAAVNLDKTVSGTGSFASLKASDVKSMITPFILGAAFKFAPNLGVNIYFESGGDVAQDQKNYRAVGANLMVSFD